MFSSTSSSVRERANELRMLTNQLMWKFISSWSIFHFFSLFASSDLICMVKNLEHLNFCLLTAMMTTWDEFKHFLSVENFCGFFGLEIKLRIFFMLEENSLEEIYYDGEIKHARNHFVAFSLDTYWRKYSSWEGSKFIFTANFMRWAVIIHISFN